MTVKTEAEYRHRMTEIIGAYEDAPATKARYRVDIGGEMAIVNAYDAYHAGRIARRMYRSNNGLAPDASTPEAEARLVTRQRRRGA